MTLILTKGPGTSWEIPVYEALETVALKSPIINPEFDTPQEQEQAKNMDEITTTIYNTIFEKKNASDEIPDDIIDGVRDEKLDKIKELVLKSENLPKFKELKDSLYNELKEINASKEIKKDFNLKPDEFAKYFTESIKTIYEYIINNFEPSYDAPSYLIKELIAAIILEDWFKKWSTLMQILDALKTK